MIFRSIALLFTILISTAMGAAPAAWADRLNVFVSIAPQQYFLEQIGKELLDVHVMVPPGASPATYEPKPRQMAALAKAEAYFSIGVPFEKAWLPRFTATNADMQIVATDHAIQKLAIADHGHEQTQQDAHGHGDESGLDPHIWTAPPLVMVQAGTILAALQTLDPSHAANYEANHKAFVEKLTALDRELHAMFDQRQGFQFMVFHPSWGYFARAYGLIQVPVEVEGKTPKPAQLKRLIAQARSKHIKVIFVQPQFSAKSAELIARSIGATVIVADPLAHDWEANLRRQAIQFDAALR